MKALILAAGEGKRLRPYTETVPKCLVEIDGISLLDRQLSVLNSCNVNDISIVGGYLSHKLRSKCLRFYINDRYYETNMLWTLLCAEIELDDDIIVSYGDIVYSEIILRQLLSSTADIAVVIDMMWKDYWLSRSSDPLSDAETLRLSDHGRILDIGQRPNSLCEIQGQYIGLMKFSAAGIIQLRAFLSSCRKSGIIDGKDFQTAYMTDALQALIKSGIVVDSVQVSSPWVEVDTVNDLKSQSTINRLKSIPFN